MFVLCDRPGESSLQKDCYLYWQRQWIAGPFSPKKVAKCQHSVQIKSNHSNLKELKIRNFETSELQATQEINHYKHTNGTKVKGWLCKLVHQFSQLRDELQAMFTCELRHWVSYAHGSWFISVSHQSGFRKVGPKDAKWHESQINLHFWNLVELLILPFSLFIIFLWFNLPSADSRNHNFFAWGIQYNKDLGEIPQSL